MDRAQELRSLMKIASKKGDSSSLSNNVTGKDKAKLLKLMKEKQKNDENVICKVPKSKENFVSKVKPPSAISTSTSKPSKLPDNFFDFESAPTETKVTTTQQPVKNSVVKISAPEVVVSAKSNTSQMPVGFFDNPTEELTARGVNIVQHKAEQQKIVDNEFQSFLSEINVLKEEGEEDILEEVGVEAAGREYEEQALQMAYMTKLAVLYQQSEAVVDKQNRFKNQRVSGSDDPQITTSTDFNELIAFSSSSSGNNNNQSYESSSIDVVSEGPPSSSVVREDVETVLYRKLQLESLRKRRLQQQHAQICQSKRVCQTKNNSTCSVMDEKGVNMTIDNAATVDDNGSGSESDDESEEEDYSPLNFMDWTAKGV